MVKTVVPCITAYIELVYRFGQVTDPKVAPAVFEIVTVIAG